jgi:hypothetical protein
MLTIEKNWPIILVAMCIYFTFIIISFCREFTINKVAIFRKFQNYFFSKFYFLEKFLFEI